ncbi:MAG: hypothetical protein IJW22_05000, partial [Clostridia bacterium]|nr:hypothetical protein [Clostridia bacterium]
DHIKNPETCVLQPGESVVVWFVNQDTYTSYYNDDDFGFSYFRQYWVNQGCAVLGEKGVDGEYNVPVIAVDGCNDAALNQTNASRVFTVSHTSSAVYGVANATADVAAGKVAISDVISIACFSMNSIYYRVTKTAQKKADGSTVYANTMICANIPVNTGMRYVVDMTYSNRISGMVQSLKVTSYYYRSGVLYSDDPDVKLRMENTTTLALQEPGLGSLSNAEAYCARDTFFLTTKEDGKNIARYYNEKKVAVSTLEGAALATEGTSPVLRFDNAVKSEVYSSLIASYGADNVKVGMLICMSDDLKNDTKMTAEGLTAAGVKYIDVASKLMYYKGEYAVLGTSVVVNEKNYNTEYTAVGYIKVTTADGVEHTFWSYTTSTRSVFDVAKAALKDVTSKEGGIYVNKVDNKFSPYTAEERALLETFMK